MYRICFYSCLLDWSLQLCCQFQYLYILHNRIYLVIWFIFRSCIVFVYLLGLIILLCVFLFLMLWCLLIEMIRGFDIFGRFCSVTGGIWFILDLWEGSNLAGVIRMFWFFIFCFDVWFWIFDMGFFRAELSILGIGVWIVDLCDPQLVIWIL